jgi:hypothetical protein
VAPVANWITSFSGEQIIPFSAVLAMQFAELRVEQAVAVCAEKGAKSMIPKIIQAGFTSSG